MKACGFRIGDVLRIREVWREVKKSRAGYVEVECENIRELFELLKFMRDTRIPILGICRDERAVEILKRKKLKKIKVIFNGNTVKIRNF